MSLKIIMINNKKLKKIILIVMMKTFKITFLNFTFVMIIIKLNIILISLIYRVFKMKLYINKKAIQIIQTKLINMSNK